LPNTPVEQVQELARFVHHTTREGRFGMRDS
jgi:hypothetical protein